MIILSSLDLITMSMMVHYINQEVSRVEMLYVDHLLKNSWVQIFAWCIHLKFLKFTRIYIDFFMWY
jgi:hypothetical protein